MYVRYAMVHIFSAATNEYIFSLILAPFRSVLHVCTVRLFFLVLFPHSEHSQIMLSVALKCIHCRSVHNEYFNVKKKDGQTYKIAYIHHAKIFFSQNPPSRMYLYKRLPIAK